MIYIINIVLIYYFNITIAIIVVRLLLYLLPQLSYDPLTIPNKISALK